MSISVCLTDIVALKLLSLVVILRCYPTPLLEKSHGLIALTECIKLHLIAAIL